MGSVYWSLSFNKGSNEKTYYTLCIARTKNEWGKNQPFQSFVSFAYCRPVMTSVLFSLY